MDRAAFSRPITSPAELVEYFRKAAKARASFRVGIEQEKLGVRDDGAPVPYLGQDGVAALLARLETSGFSATKEDGHTLALERAGDRITVEPGGQIELSAAALPTALACRDALYQHVAEVAAAARPLGIRFVAGGFRPFGRLEDVAWLPKRRYAVMKEYLPGKGRLAHEMMQRTATVQANFDFEDEADALERLRTAFGVTSIVTALFAASPITEGRPNGWKSYRAAVWLETDPDRCGLLPFVFHPGASFADYVEWALDVSMFFLVRDGVYRPAGATFRRFLHEGLGGERATLADWEIHLSTLFPEVRLKTYIEVRGADAGPLPVAAALPALWRGLLDDREARAAAWALVASVSDDEREALRRGVPKMGLAAELGGRPLRDLAVEIVRLAGAGLRRLPGGVEDAALLEPLAAYAAAGRCPADDMLDDFHALGGDPRKLVDRWELSAAR